MVHPPLADLAARIADGTPIDWDGLAAEMPGLPPAVAHGAQLVEGLARLHASLSPADTFSTSLFSTIDASIGGTGVLSAPVTWGPLTILERLGQGTFGEVYRALDRRLNRPVALKLLRHKDRRELAVIEEGHLMARVRHPNVVTVYGAERIDGRVGLWMEFVDGKTLDQDLRDRGRFEPDEVQRIGADLAAALEAVHRAGLLHRDVKAQNVMRDAGGRTLLTDFGAGQDYTGQEDPTAAGLAGTPLYLAPEVLDGGAPSPASDIYSLGVLLFHLATGSFPVEGCTLEELRDAHRKSLRPLLSSRSPRLPTRLAASIERALDPDPGRRFATALEFERALRPHAPSRWRAVWPAAAAVAVVGVAAFLTRSWWLPVGSDPGRHLTQLAPDVQAKFVFRGAAIDGRWMPCSPRGSGGSVAICDLATGSAQVLRSPVARTRPDQPSENAPVSPQLLSPDGRTLAYNWDVTVGGVDGVTTRTLRAVGADGRNDRPLYASPGMTLINKWMPDGRHLFVREMVSGSTRDLLIPLDGSAPAIIGGRTPADFGSDLSPDRKTLVVSRRLGPADHDLVAIDLATGSVRWQLQEPADETFPKWTPDGRGLVYVSDGAGGEHLMFVPVTAAGPGTPVVLREMGRSRAALIAFGSADALYMEVSGPPSTAYIADADLGRGTVERERPLDPRTIEDTMGADWDPKGDRHAYLRGRSNRLTSPAVIVIRDRDGHIIREIPVDGAVLRAGSLVRWSPDGRRLAVVTRDGPQAVLRVIHLEKGDQQVLAAEPVLFNPRWDGTSTALYYYTRRVREGGKPGPGPSEIVRHELEGDPELIYRPTDSVNLHALGVFDVAPETGAIATFVNPHRVPRYVIRVVNGQQHRDFPIDHPDYTAIAWVGSGPMLLFSKVISQQQSEIWLLDTASGDRRRLRTTEPNVMSLSVRPDGKQIMFTAGNPRPDVWVFRGLSTVR